MALHDVGTHLPIHFVEDMWTAQLIELRGTGNDVVSRSSRNDVPTPVRPLKERANDLSVIEIMPAQRSIGDRHSIV